MTTESNQTNPLERRLQLTIPLDSVRQETEKRLRKLARTVRVQGFRPGKVPYRMVVQQYGPSVEEDAINALAQDRFGAELRTLKLAVAGMPRFEAVPAGEADHFEFAATFEVYPEIILGSWEGRVLERTVTTVVDEDVDRTLELLRRQRMTYRTVSREAALEDRVTMDFTGMLDGVEFPGGKGTDVALVLGSGRFLADFEQALIGLAAGQDKTFPMTFPPDYPAANLAGKTVTFSVHVRDVAEPALPEIDEEFLEAVGVAEGGEEALRRELRSNLEREVRQKLRSQLKEAAMSLLLEVAPIPVPSVLVGTEIGRLRSSMIEDIQAQNPAAKIPELPDNVFEATALRRVALGLIVSEVVRQEKLEPKAEEVRALVEELSSAYEHPEDVVQWTYQNPEQLRQVEAVALEESVVRWVCSKVELRDVTKTFAELAQSGQSH